MKLVRKIITSKIFIIVFVISVLLLGLNAISYNKNSANYEHAYSIEYSLNTSYYDEKIDEINKMIESLDKLSDTYDSSFNYLVTQKNIYEKLKTNNIDYDKVYDFGYGFDSDRLSYLIYCQSLMVFLIVINGFVLLYLIFTREFDSGVFVHIYENTRYKIIIKKIMIFFILFIIEIFVLIGLNLIFSLSEDNRFSEVLIIRNNIPAFMSDIKYILLFNIFNIIYISLFLFSLFIGISLLVKKTGLVILFIFITIVLIFIFGLLKINIVPYLGLSVDFDILSIRMSLFIRIVILIPILFLIFCIYRFEKSDL